MENGFLISQVKRVNRNLFIINLIVFFCVIAIFLMNSNYLYNVFTGPYKADFQWLGSITDPTSVKEKYIEFKSPNVNNMYFHDIVEEYESYSKEVKKTTIESDYLLVGIDEKFVIVKVPHGRRGSTFIGEITSLPSEVINYATEIMLDRGYTSAEILQSLQPILVDASGNYKTVGYIMVVIGSLLLIMVFWNLSKFVRRNLDPYSHPIFKSLSAYGNSKDMTEYMENELKQGNVVTLEKFTLTDNWVIYKEFFSLSILKISDLIWLYKRVTTHRVNFVPTGKTFEIVINNNRKKSRSFQISNEANADIFLEEIYYRAPWIALGYSDDFRNLWARNFRQFVELVDSRKTYILNSAVNRQENSQGAYDTGNNDV